MFLLPPEGARDGFESFFDKIGLRLGAHVPEPENLPREAAVVAAADEAAGAQAAVPFLPGNPVRHEGRGDGRGAGFFAFGVETDAKGR